MPSHGYVDMIRQVEKAALLAGEKILEIYDTKPGYSHKADGSYVTDADSAAEKIILPALRAIDPSIPVISEEEFSCGDSPEITGNQFWLVDPMDGTRQFVERTGQFTVNISLVKDGVPVLGIIYIPVKGVLYGGLVKQPPQHSQAWRWDKNNGRRNITTSKDPRGGYRIVESNAHGNKPKLESYLQKITVSNRQFCGSSLKFCAVAEGKADLYPRFGKTTMEWDTAAGHAIIRAAGGDISTLNGKPLRYGKPGFRNDSFIAHGNFPCPV